LADSRHVNPRDADQEADGLPSPAAPGLAPEDQGAEEDHGEGDPDERHPADWQEDEITRLHELRWQTTEGWIDAELRLGRHGEVIAELRSLTLAHPLRERFHEQLMLALYRSGRQAEALAVYRRVRALLVRDLGIEPSAALRRLNEAVLEGAPTPAQRPAPAPASTSTSTSNAPGAAEGSPARSAAADAHAGGARYQLPARLSDLAAASGLPRPTAHRLLAQLIEVGSVRQGGHRLPAGDRPARPRRTGVRAAAAAAHGAQATGRARGAHRGRGLAHRRVR
jgi:Bacterial transcriptional activator domain/IclR helix-turn-helix domain